MQRARKARRSGTDDQHIRFQALALDWHFVILAEGRMSALWGSPELHFAFAFQTLTSNVVVVRYV